MLKLRLFRLLAASRAGEWWDYKLPPVLAVFYAAALYQGLPAGAWLACQVQLLGALVSGAMFVSVINDLSDCADDARVGKANRLTSAGPLLRALALGAPLAAGLAWCLVWRDRPALLIPYVAAWLAFAAYSLPPLRLKRRGWSGAVADAAGAHLLPALLAVALAAEAAGKRPALAEAAVVGVWALAYGLRGILWHQLDDRANDRAAGVATLAARSRPEALQMLVRRVIFPIEIAALLVLLVWLLAPAAWAALILYGLTAAQRVVLWRMRPVLVAPEARGLIVLAEFYAVLLPIALLLTALADDAAGAAAAFAVHLAVFGRANWRAATDLVRIEWLQAAVLRHATANKGHAPRR